MISRRAQTIQPSATLTISAKAKSMQAEGKDVIGLASGQPDFVTPDYIRSAAIEAINAGQTYYTPGAGTPELRQAICTYIERSRGRSFTPAQVIVTAGAKQAIANALLATVDDGDEVIIPAPYWVTYPEAVGIADGRAVIVDTHEEDDFLLTADALKAAITLRTRALILNTPSNPTGCLYSRKKLEELFAVLEGTDIYVIADEIYCNLVYGDAGHVSPLALSDDAAARTILVDGVSKMFAMTGWRIGFAAGPEDVISACSRVQAHMTSCASSISQAAALAAYTIEDPATAEMLAAFDERRQFMVKALQALDGVTCREPLGAFYCFPNVSSCYGGSFDGRAVTGSASFCEILLDTKGVALVPGSAFGADGFVRLSYAVSLEDIGRAMDRFGEFLSEVK